MAAAEGAKSDSIMPRKMNELRSAGAIKKTSVTATFIFVAEFWRLENLLWATGFLTDMHFSKHRRHCSQLVIITGAIVASPMTLRDWSVNKT